MPTLRNVGAVAAILGIVGSVQAQDLNQNDPPYATTRIEDVVDVTPTTPATSPEEVRCLAKAMYYEARGESVKGQLAVAQVIVNRANSIHFADTVCDVISEGVKRPRQRGGCQFSFKCDGTVKKPIPPHRLEPFLKLAEDVLTGAKRNVAAGEALFFHATYVRAGWSKHYKRVAVIGNHAFYSLR